MKKRNLWSVALSAALAALCLGQTAAYADDDIGERWTTQDRIEGVWLTKVTLTNCATGDPLPFPGARFDAMGGAMDIDSKAGGGTRVTVTSPPEPATSSSALSQ